MVLEDHGTFVDPEDFYSSSAYVQRLGFVGSTMLRLLAVQLANAELDRVGGARP